MNKNQILSALQDFVNQRPGLETAMYGDMKSYRSDYRQVLQAKHDFESMLAQVEWLDESITANKIIDASKTAFSGRLTIVENGESIELDYCTGQYFPMEYRNAACAVLASVLWDYYRDSASTGDDIRKAARDQFGRGLASRYFN